MQTIAAQDQVAADCRLGARVHHQAPSATVQDERGATDLLQGFDGAPSVTQSELARQTHDSSQVRSRIGEISRLGWRERPLCSASQNRHAPSASVDGKCDRGPPRQVVAPEQGLVKGRVSPFLFGCDVVLQDD
jgi:hypothetical protein